MQTPSPSQRADGLSANDYILDTLLGEGALSRVYRATMINTGEAVAIKVIPKQKVINSLERATVFAERTCLTKLRNSPHILQLRASFQDQQNLYFVLELAGSGDVAELITRLGRLPAMVAKHFAAELLVAMKHLRLHGVAHRDIKPQNLLLTSDMHVRLSDFNSSLVVEDGRARRGQQGLDCASAMVGTLAYIPPEMASRRSGGGGGVGWHAASVETEIPLRRHSHTDDRASSAAHAHDLWAFGCVIYEMIVGKPPFAASTVQLTLERIVHGHLILPQNIPKDASDLIRKLLVPQPLDREGLRRIEDIFEHPYFEGIDFESLETDVMDTQTEMSRVLALEEQKDVGAAMEYNEFTPELGERFKGVRLTDDDEDSLCMEDLRSF